MEKALLENPIALLGVVISISWTAIAFLRGDEEKLAKSFGLFFLSIWMATVTGIYSEIKSNDNDEEVKNNFPILERSIMRYQELHKDHALPKNLEILQSSAALGADESVDGKVYGPFITSELVEKMQLRKNWQGLFTDTTTTDITCHRNCTLYNPETRSLKCDKRDTIIYLPPYENSTDPFEE